MDDIFEKAQLITAYQNVFTGSEFGKLVLMDLASRAYMDRPTVTDDPHMTYFNEGRRSIVLEIMETLHMNVRQFMVDSIETEDT